MTIALIDSAVTLIQPAGLFVAYSIGGDTNYVMVPTTSCTSASALNTAIKADAAAKANTDPSQVILVGGAV